MSIRILLSYIAKKQLSVFIALVVGFFINCIVLINQNNKSLDISLNKLQDAIQTNSSNTKKYISDDIKQKLNMLLDALQDGTSIPPNHQAAQDLESLNGVSLSLSIQSAFYHSLPFDHLLTYTPINDDEYLMEIAKNGVATTKELQKEFFSEILPQILEHNSINIENDFLSRWIKIKYQARTTTEQLELLVKQVSMQDFSIVVQTINFLPYDIQKILKKWQEKVSAYVYAKESLKKYLE